MEKTEANPRVLVTREPDRNDDDALEQLLHRAGFEAVHRPLVQSQRTPSQRWKELRQALDDSAAPRILMLASARAARLAHEFVQERDFAAIYVVGTATAAAAQELGWGEARLGTNPSAGGLANAIIKDGWLQRGATIIAARSANGRKEGLDSLETAGATVLSADLYETRIAESVAPLEAPVHWITLTSPLAAQGLGGDRPHDSHGLRRAVTESPRDAGCAVIEQVGGGATPRAPNALSDRRSFRASAVT
jgi:uroporphyrinogen-III synthase